MAISASTRILLVAGAAVLVSCSERIEKDDAANQVKEVVRRVYPDCGVDVWYEGVGEGDADNVYDSFTFGTRKSSNQNQIEVEVLFSRASSGRWEIPSRSAEHLAQTIGSLCAK